MIEIAVDIMGADNSAEQLFGGVTKALDNNKDLKVVVFGDERELSSYNVEKYGDRIEIIDAPDAITNGENPVEAFGLKKDASIVKAFKYLRGGSASGFVTCGATGAVFVAAMMTLKKIGYVTLVCEPKKTDGRPFVIADCGANVDCRPDKIIGFSHMGVAYMKSIGCNNPRVGLLSNGAEDKKGNEFTKKANELLRNGNINFVGNVEGNDIFTCAADVIVCDGFSGNILLKTIEGTAKSVIAEARSLGIEGDALDTLYDRYNYTECGGATLLGFSVPIVKGHGAATAATVKSIIDSAYTLAKNNIVDKIQSEFKIA
ncbi:MAG: phosphate acyltransferase [Clostridiales bacterium]|nr:phosphate acyltransferase [Clostridiales bacterium]